MKVRDLIEQLQNMDQGLDVILQKDSEGNGFSPLAGVYTNAIYAPGAWIEMLDASGSADDADMEEDEWEAIKQRERCAVLFPLN